MVKETHGLEVPVHCAHTLLKENRHTLCNMSLMRCQCQAETERYRAKGNWGRLRWTGKHEMWAWGPESQTHEAKSGALEHAVGTSCSMLHKKICHLSPMVMSHQKLMYKPYKPYIYCICEPSQLVYTYTVYVYGITVYIQYSIVYSWSLTSLHSTYIFFTFFLFIRHNDTPYTHAFTTPLVPYHQSWLLSRDPKMYLSCLLSRMAWSYYPWVSIILCFLSLFCVLSHLLHLVARLVEPLSTLCPVSLSHSLLSPHSLGQQPQSCSHYLSYISQGLACTLSMVHRQSGLGHLAPWWCCMHTHLHGTSSWPTYFPKWQILHLLAMAHAADINLMINDFQTVADCMPYFTDLKSSGR